jgi:hypothetical protein
MQTLSAIRESAFSARARLLAFEQLLRQGVNIYQPVANGDGLDATVRCEDGRFIDLIVRPSASEHEPLRFASPAIEPRDNLFVLCVAWALSPMQVWVVPSPEFATRAEQLPDGWLSLDLDSVDAVTGQKHKVMLGHTRNAWRLITDGAVKSLVAY